MELNNHQRDTVRRIFRHPAGHNIEWRAVVSLLEAVGTVEQRDGKLAVRVAADTAFLDVPSGKDIDVSAVVELRRLLAAAGYEA